MSKPDSPLFAELFPEPTRPRRIRSALVAAVLGRRRAAPTPHRSAPDRPSAAAWGRRIGWALVPVASLGYLAWVPALRLATRTRGVAGWAAFTVFLTGSVTEVVLITVVPEDSSAVGWVGGYIVLLTAAAAGHAVVALRPRRRQPDPRSAEPLRRTAARPCRSPAPPGRRPRCR